MNFLQLREVKTTLVKNERVEKRENDEKVLREAVFCVRKKFILVWFGQKNLLICV